VLEKLPKRVSWVRELKRLLLEEWELRQAFSTLYSGLILNKHFGSGKSILVTSARPQDGKTTVAACLAITAALVDQSALLINGDLRKRGGLSAMETDEDLGLGEVLQGQIAFQDAIHLVEPFSDARTAGTLSIMSAGRKSPLSLPGVNWSDARKIFQALSEHFGVVIIDSPPVFAATDALLYAGMVDMVLLVISAGNTDRNELRRLNAMLESAGTPVVGAVLNKFYLKGHGKSFLPYGSRYYDSDEHLD
jgi:capsular exopolysaccharide synthesis family protein